MDRAEFARALSRASREANGFGAIYWGAAELVELGETVDESGIRLAPYDASAEPTYDATNDATEADEMTPRVPFVPHDALDARR